MTLTIGQAIVIILGSVSLFLLVFGMVNQARAIR